MTAKEYLEKIKSISESINRSLEYIDKLEAIATKTTPSLEVDKVQTSNTNRQEQAYINLIHAKAEISEIVNSNLEELQSFVLLVNKIDNKAYKDLLTFKYSQGLGYKEIAKKLNYADNYIHELHAKAVEEFCKIYRG